MLLDRVELQKTCCKRVQVWGLAFRAWGLGCPRSGNAHGGQAASNPLRPLLHCLCELAGPAGHMKTGSHGSVPK